MDRVFAKITDASNELNKMSAQFICPKDTFFASMASLMDRSRTMLQSLIGGCRKAFITCESNGAESDYRVVLKFRTLADAQAFHSSLVVDLPECESMCE